MRKLLNMHFRRMRAFSAGLTPPPGTFASDVAATYGGQITGAVSFGGVTLNAGFKVSILSLL